MADAKISALTALTGANVDAAADVLAIVDTSVTTTKKITVSELASAIIPAGLIFDFGGTVAPSGYLPCDGSAVSRATYAALFTAISTTWGVGDNSTTFNVPNFQRKVAVGSGGSGTATLANSVGSTGGEETHTLTTAELAAHSHTAVGGTGTFLTGNNTTTGPATNNGNPTLTGQIAATDTAGSGTAHNNMQPANVVLKIIKT